jgi:hypothetical protein
MLPLWHLSIVVGAVDVGRTTVPLSVTDDARSRLFGSVDARAAR